MRYYKIISQDTFYGVGSSGDMRCYQRKHKVLLGCDEQDAQYIQVDDNLYHANWMISADKNDLSYISAEIIEISQDEYDALKKAVESCENIDVSEPVQKEPELPELNLAEEVTIQHIKDKKISEMSKMCNAVITKGFDTALEDGEIHHFSLTTQDQLNLITLQAMIQSGQSLVPYHADNESCRFFSAADIQTVLTGATNHITYHVSYFNALKGYVNSLDDIKKVDAIKYGEEIPKEYQTEVLQYLTIMINN